MKKKWIIISIIAVAIIFALVFYFVKIPLDKQSSIDSLVKENQQQGLKSENSESIKEEINIDKKENAGSNGCVGKGIVNLTSPPRPLDQIAFIEPMGLMIGGHVTPIDHQYYYPYNFRMSSEITINDLKDVLAPGDGIITEVSRMPDFFAVKNTEFKDYRITIYYTCDLYSIYIHIYELTPEIEEQVKDLTPGNTKQVNIQVKSGQLIGKTNSFDFSLHNNNVILTGFVIPEHYNREPWKIHTVDPFDYFTEPIRSQLLEKSLRKAKPYGGKIDNDIDGKLIGNWFKENTNGYQGIKEPEYWTTHVSFSPDGHDPSYFLISLGDFKGEAMQFGTKTNSPNPRDVDVTSGLIKYELVSYDYVDSKGAHWDRVSPINEIKAISSGQGIVGVVLVQLIEDRKIKLEIFPDKKANDVSGFTDKAAIYER